VQVRVEGVRNAQERVDPRRPSTALETRDRGLSRSDERGEIGLREAAFATPVRHLFGDLGEQPALLGTGEPGADSLQGLTHISNML